MAVIGGSIPGVRIGRVLVVNGTDLYAVTLSSTSTIQVLRSTDGGSTWTQRQTFAAAAAVSALDARFDGSDTIWVAYISGSIAYYGVSYTISTNTFAAGSSGGANLAFPGTLTIPRSTGHLSMFTPTTGNVMGTPYRRVAYIGTGVSLVAIGAAIDYDLAALIMSSGGRAYMFYTGVASGVKTLYCRVMRTGDTVVDTTIATISNTAWPVGQPVMTGSRVAIPYVTTGGALAVAYSTDQDTPSWASMTLTGTTPESVNSNPAALADDGTTLRVFWVADSDQAIHTATSANNGTSWGSSSSWKTGVTATRITASAVSGGVAAVYESGGDVIYEAYSAGGGSASATLTVTTATGSGPSATATGGAAATLVAIATTMSAPAMTASAGSTATMTVSAATATGPAISASGAASPDASATMAVTTAAASSPIVTATGGAVATMGVEIASASSPAITATGGAVANLSAGGTESLYGEMVYGDPYGGAPYAAIATAPAITATVTTDTLATLAVVSGATSAPPLTASGGASGALVITASAATSPEIAATGGADASVTVATASGSAPAATATGGAVARLGTRVDVPVFGEAVFGEAVFGGTTSAMTASSSAGTVVASGGSLAVLAASVAAAAATSLAAAGGGSVVLAVNTATGVTPSGGAVGGGAATLLALTASGLAPPLTATGGAAVALSVSTAAASAPAATATGGAVARLGTRVDVPVFGEAVFGEAVFGGTTSAMTASGLAPTVTGRGGAAASLLATTATMTAPSLGVTVGIAIDYGWFQRAAVDLAEDSPATGMALYGSPTSDLGQIADSPAAGMGISAMMATTDLGQIADSPAAALELVVDDRIAEAPMTLPDGPLAGVSVDWGITSPVTPVTQVTAPTAIVGGMSANVAVSAGYATMVTTTAQPEADVATVADSPATVVATVDDSPATAVALVDPGDGGA